MKRFDMAWNLMQGLHSVDDENGGFVEYKDIKPLLSAVKEAYICGRDCEEWSICPCFKSLANEYICPFSLGKDFFKALKEMSHERPPQEERG